MDSPPDGHGSDWLKTLNDKARSSDKSWTTAFLLSIFLGCFGADRFYLGYGIGGLIKLLTLGVGGIWWIGDIVLIGFNLLKDAHGGKLDGRFRR